MKIMGFRVRKKQAQLPLSYLLHSAGRVQGTRDDLAQHPHKGMPIIILITLIIDIIGCSISARCYTNNIYGLPHLLLLESNGKGGQLVPLRNHRRGSLAERLTPTSFSCSRVKMQGGVFSQKESLRWHSQIFICSCLTWKRSRSLLVSIIRGRMSRGVKKYDVTFLHI